ncbi:equilibrative nucleoside transporter 2 [Bufo bufo]|uniref:equilibrative nucleoside transporter 2 n=1 Tax=Bufo bufo TaxID=8384 RepID=UPI001ABDBF99|nr:equilibrative nucleoside transporter 2 [Bufo bufo]XP_040265436.1 equilibrative nucleoside transporter 2 [Bufo bufo]
MPRKDEPQDKFYFVTIIFLMLGLGTLLPWNFFITAIPYFQTRLCSETHTLYGNSSKSNDLSESRNVTTQCKDEFNFNNWMTLLAQLPLLLCTLLNSFIYQWIPERVRIAGSMLAILSLFIFTAVLVKVEMDAQCFFDLTMATIWFINAFCAILQGSLFGLLTLFPQHYSSMFLSGQGMAGTFAALAMLLSMSSGANHRTIALGYFVTPCFGTFISIICYFLLYRLDFAQYYLSKSNTNSSKTYELETKAELLHPGEENGDAAGQKKAVLLKEAEAGGIGEKKQSVSVCIVLKKIWVMALTIVITFGVTLSVFPAITAKVVSNIKDEGWKKFFNPVCCFLIFNIMDWIGRSITSKTLWPGPDSKYLPLFAAIRFIFVPLFMLCHIQDHNYLPTFFKNDAWFIIFMIFFSVSNGYFVSLPMCLAPKKVLSYEGETTGALMTFFLALGLSVGAGLSFGFKALL